MEEKEYTIKLNEGDIINLKFNFAYKEKKTFVILNQRLREVSNN